MPPPPVLPPPELKRLSAPPCLFPPSEFIELPRANLYDWWQIPPPTPATRRRAGIRQRIATVIESRAYEYLFLAVVALNAGYIFALASLGDDVGDRCGCGDR